MSHTTDNLSWADKTHQYLGEHFMGQLSLLPKCYNPCKINHIGSRRCRSEWIIIFIDKKRPQEAILDNNRHLRDS